MSSTNNKGPIIDLGMCRCCGNMKKCRILNLEYEFKGRTEIYSEIIFDCFGILLSNLDKKPEELLICATCVVRLRDANKFRRQVLQCEETLLKSKCEYYVEVEPKSEPKEKNKIEASDSEKSDDDSDNGVTYSDTDVQNEELDKEDTSRSASTKPREVNKVLRQQFRLRSGVPVKRSNNLLKEWRDKIDPRRKSLNRNKRISTSTTNKSDTQKAKGMFDKSARLLNAIAIVENSYVCPFDTVYNDYRCIYCSELFAQADSLRQHTSEHDPSTYQNHVDSTSKYIFIDITRIDCRLCETGIESIDMFKSHLNNEHNKNLHPVNNEITVITFKLENAESSCTVCDKKYDFIQPLKQHMAEHHGACICDVCGSHFFDEVVLRKHKSQTHNPDAKKPIFECKLCHRTFKSKASERYHTSRVHSNTPFYSCNKCDKTFSTYHFRLKHKIEEHDEVRVFPCDSCGKVFNMKMRLREHKRRSHLQILHHACTYCDMKFYIPSALKSHMVSHTGERNFRCEMCGKTYPRKSALRAHIGSHK